jgi:hypothetical protein
MKRATDPTEALARAAAGELLGPADMMAIFHVSPATFYRHRARGDFHPFMVKPAIGAHCYSGVLVHRYLRNEPLYEPTFGGSRKRAGGISA